MELVYEAMVKASLKPPVMVGAGPYGVRLVFELLGGEIAGERVNGKVVSVGGDWLLLGADGHGRLDVRAQFETSDGAIIYAQFFGIVELNPAVNKALLGAETQYDDQYFRIAPQVETGSPDYAWMNHALFVGEGRFTRGLGLEYKLYRVA